MARSTNKRQLAPKDEISWSANPSQDGSYLKRALDIGEALVALDLDREGKHVQFMFYFMAAEKLGMILIAVSEDWPCATALDKRNGCDPDKVSHARGKIGFATTDEVLNKLFDPRSKDSARNRRNRFAHQMGPTHLLEIGKPDPRGKSSEPEKAQAMIPLLKEFIQTSIPRLEEYLKREGANTNVSGPPPKSSGPG